MDLCWQINCLCFLICCLGQSYVNCSLRFIYDLSLWGKGRGPLSDRLVLGPGGDGDISEGLPGEPLSPLIHTQTRGPSACPAPAMSPCLLGCVVFCLLQAGESWGQGPLGGASTEHVRCDCSIGPPSPQGRSSLVSPRTPDSRS